MPELPEVHALTMALAERMRGRRIDRCRLNSFAALKTVTPGLEDVEGRVVADVIRRGKFVCIDTDGLWLVAHLARGGWIRWYDSVPTGPLRPGRGPIALRLVLHDGSGFDLTEHGTEKRVALWVVRAPDEVGPLAALGADPLDETFTVARFGSILDSTSATLKHLLTTQSLIAGVGNAYSDEALHRAGLSPFARTAGLDGPARARLHDAVVEVLRAAVDRATSAGIDQLKGEKKRAMAVHGRTGQPCPACGTTIREVRYATRSLQYCPTCQTGGRLLADRRLSRLLK